jgi:hypothetical protein
MSRSWLVPGLIVVVATALAYALGTERRRHREGRSLKQEVSKWEDEGGRVPGATLADETTPQKL